MSLGSATHLLIRRFGRTPTTSPLKPLELEEAISTFTSGPDVAPWQQAAVVVYALAGGYADATGYLLTRTFTGHVTGNLVLLAISLPHPQRVEISHRFVAILTFLLATGIGFRVARFRNALSPWTLFLAQAILVGIVSLPVVRGSQNYATWLVMALCLALGLQNGAVTSVGGVSLHATFLSGNLTSVVGEVSKGSSGGAGSSQQQHRSPVVSKGTLLVIVSMSFVVGAYCADLLIGKFGTLVPIFLLIPFCVAAALWAAPMTSVKPDENT